MIRLHPLTIVRTFWLSLQTSSSEWWRIWRLDQIGLTGGHGEAGGDGKVMKDAAGKQYFFKSRYNSGNICSPHRLRFYCQRSWCQILANFNRVGNSKAEAWTLNICYLFKIAKVVLANNSGHSGEREAGMKTLVSVTLGSAKHLYLTTRT